jgi:hypothetical protein
VASVDAAAVIVRSDHKANVRADAERLLGQLVDGLA